MMYANPNTVYSQGGRMYTTNGFNPYERYYFDQVRPTPPQFQPSNINNLVTQAMQAQANVPTLSQLFPSFGGMNFGNPSTSMGGLLSGTGQFGAGRFLGNNVMGNPSLTTT